MKINRKNLTLLLHSIDFSDTYEYLAKNIAAENFDEQHLSAIIFDLLEIGRQTAEIQKCLSSIYDDLLSDVATKDEILPILMESNVDKQ